MSEVYVLEPATNGKVVLHTSHGDLDIELWAKECPKTCRNFVQLCMDSYYDNAPFHRIIKDFVIQGGDPTGTGLGGESIYGTNDFPTEVHPRLLYRYRGLVGLSALNPDHDKNERDPEFKSNRQYGSQFFITLSRADALNRKNTLFGKVTGHSLYNLLSIADVPVDPLTDRPNNPPYIISTDVLYNPFPDMNPRPGSKTVLREEELERKRILELEEASKKRSDTFRDTLVKKKQQLLSFEEEEEEEEEQEINNITVNTLTSSNIQVPEKLIQPISIQTSEKIISQQIKLQELKNTIHNKLRCTPTGVSTEDPGQQQCQTLPNDLEECLDTQEKTKDKTIQLSSETENKEDDSNDDESNDDASSDDESSEDRTEVELKVVTESRKRRKEEINRLTIDILSFKNGQGTINKDDREKELIQDANLLTEYEKRRQLYLSRNRQTSKRDRQNEVLKKLKDFQTKLRKSTTRSTDTSSALVQETKSPIINEEEGIDQDDNEWFNGAGLRFAVDSARAYELDAAKDTLVSFDPLASKSKSEINEKMRKLQADRMKPSLNKTTFI